MKTLNVKISDGEFTRFGFSSDNIDFNELLLNVKLEIARQALDKSVKLAEKYGLSSMYEEEIEAELKANRN